MKKYYSLLIIMLCYVVTDAQTTLRYRFNGGLHELGIKGPALKAICQGTYKYESLPAGNAKNVYRFEKGCGVIYDDATKNLLSSGSYTIELYFKLDTISGYKKIIDYDSMRVDAGFYNFGGKLVLYNVFTSADSFLADNKYNYVVVTRNGSTKDMFVYVNNKVAGMINDAQDKYKYGTDKLLTFFRDDKGTSGEHTGGSVAMINISDYVMDSNTVKSNFSGLASRMTVDEMENQQVVKIYPNPVTNSVQLEVPFDAACIITDVSGRIIRKRQLMSGLNSMNMYNWPSGIYFLSLTDQASSTGRVYKIVKQ